MQYVIFVRVDGKLGIPYTAPVPDRETEYLRQAASTLRPLSEQAYSNGMLYILHTMAKYSYVLDGADVYWCAEWDPGLIVIRFSPDGRMDGTALRSPVPDFEGLEASASETEQFDEDADNPQYNLIHDPWDSHFDADKREWRSFFAASEDVVARFNAAVARASELGAANQALPDDDRRAWSDQCVENLKIWAGDGVRLD